MNEEKLEQLQMELCATALEIIRMDKTSCGFNLTAAIEGVEFTIDVKAKLAEE